MKTVDKSGACVLTKGDEVFNFSRNLTSDNRKRYFGGRGAFGSYSSSVKANDDKRLSSNDTRFQSIDSASVLFDLVIEKMLKSEKFNLRETKPIEHDMETQL